MPFFSINFAVILWWILLDKFLNKQNFFHEIFLFQCILWSKSSFFLLFDNKYSQTDFWGFIKKKILFSCIKTKKQQKKLAQNFKNFAWKGIFQILCKFNSFPLFDRSRVHTHISVWLFLRENFGAAK